MVVPPAAAAAAIATPAALKAVPLIVAPVAITEQSEIYQRFLG